MARFFKRLSLLAGLVGGLSFSSVSFALTLTPLVENIDRPWSLAFLPNGDMLITERTGSLLLIDGETFARQEIANVPDVYVAGQGGMLDVVLHPDFADNQLVYLSYAYGDRAQNNTRVARGRLVGSALEGVEVLFTASPYKDTPQHYAGRMVFLPDGTFLLATGDGFDYREDAQDLMSHMGKVIRLNADGSVPNNNPFVGRDDALPEIFTYGHRNPQGLAYDAVRNEIVLHEHGPRGGDEINILEPGRNYGWPAITYGTDYSGAVISPFTEAERMEQPLLQWTPSIAPSGLAVYYGDVFPVDWQGDYLVGALAWRQVRRVDMFEGRIIKQEEHLVDYNERIRDVRVGPDGALYVLTDRSGGSLVRLTP